MNWNWSYSPETLNSGQNRRFFVLCDLEIWWITLENKRAPLLYYTKLCASFQIHRWIKIGVTVRKRSIWVKIGNFLPCVTLKFDAWPCKTIGHLFYATSSFVYHFIPIGEFKFELQSGNAQFGSNSTIFRAVRPWNLMDDREKPIGHLFYATSSFVQHFVPIGELKLELQSRNAKSGSNLTIIRAVRPWNLTDDLAKQKGTFSMPLQALCIISYPLVNSNLSYSPETLNSGQNRRFF